MKLPDPPSYSAVRAMLARLEAKGVIRHKEKGLKYVYSPTTPRAAVRRSALQRLVRVFFGGSSGAAVNALLDAEEWSPEDLEPRCATWWPRPRSGCCCCCRWRRCWCRRG